MKEAAVYFDHVWSLMIPGRKVREHKVIPDEIAAVGSLEGWSDAELGLLIEECRATIAGQHQRFDRLRTTAQVVLPLAIALLAIISGRYSSIAHQHPVYLRHGLYAGWWVGAVLVLLSAIGAGATLSVRSDFGAVLPTLLSQNDPPVMPVLARAYAEQVPLGETTIGTRITVIREAVSLLALGGLVHLVVWAIVSVPG
jgi:hypothetical protein